MRGFDGAAFGDPRQVEWAPGATDARHVWILQAGRGGKLGNFSLFARLQSGLPFTPLVQGDVNGDGRSGDRAWVSAPSQVSDPRLASGLRAIETSGSSIARDCLATSIARLGARNACRGPWTRSMSASWQPPLNFGSSSWRNRIVMNVFADNILGGIDQLVHGDGNMRGWGGVVTPDPVLLVPRSFDPVTRRFGYDVNPRFAETRPSRSSWHATSPRSLTVWPQRRHSTPSRQPPRRTGSCSGSSRRLPGPSEHQTTATGKQVLLCRSYFPRERHHVAVFREIAKRLRHGGLLDVPQQRERRLRLRGL